MLTVTCPDCLGSGCYGPLAGCPKCCGHAVGDYDNRMGPGTISISVEDFKLFLAEARKQGLV